MTLNPQYDIIISRGDDMEQQIQKLMKNLEISREEALDIIASDKAIDKGEKLFELTAEQKKAEKQARITTRTKVDAYGKKTTREKKVNNDKIFLIDCLMKALADGGCQVGEVANQEREFEFTYKETKYKIVMSVPRK